MSLRLPLTRTLRSSPRSLPTFTRLPLRPFSNTALRSLNLANRTPDGSVLAGFSKLSDLPSPAEKVGVPAVDTSKGKVWDSADEAIKDLGEGLLVLSAGQWKVGGDGTCMPGS
jgi:hypothetical protein